MGKPESRPSTQVAGTPEVAHGGVMMGTRFARIRRGLRPAPVLAVMLVLGAVPLVARADDSAPAPPARSALSAYESVREGNRLLRDGQAEEAIKAYEQAKTLAPDAREIPFARGIAEYELGRFDEARRSFQEAALSSDRALAADATYGVGAAHHAEALAHRDDPKQVLSHLEQAMSQYRTLLANQPDHAFAREADSKAARMWKQVKQQLQQQQQQQQNDQQQDQEQEPSDQQQQQPQDGENPEEQSEQQQQPQEQPSQEQQSQEQKQPSGEQDQKEGDPSQEQTSQAEHEQQNQQDKEQAASEQRTSREQAERRLREMMQELRDRRKLKGQPVEKPVIAPVEKDW